jgi:streptomycin 6-kinase
MDTLNLPKTFVQNIKDIYGNNGQDWLDGLPQNLRYLENLWDVKLKKTMPNLTYSYVALAETKSGLSVIKVAPKSERLDREICWYQAQKTGCAHLILNDKEQGALLLEYLQPGVSLKQKVIEGQDDEATEIIAQVIIELNAPKITGKTPFPHVSELLKDLELLKGKIPSSLFSYGCDLFHRLLEIKDNLLLHGDLHHDNILSHGEKYLAIDPHGYVGPQAFEVGAFIRNPYDCFPKNRSLEEMLSLRLNILYKLLPFSREEINGWALVYTLIAASWSVQDHGELPIEHFHIANIIRSNSETY